MAISAEFVSEIESLPKEDLDLLGHMVFFMKYRKAMELDDNTYLASIPGMMDRITEGVNTPLSECIPLEEVLPGV